MKTARLMEAFRTYVAAAQAFSEAWERDGKAGDLSEAYPTAMPDFDEHVAALQFWLDAHQPRIPEGHLARVERARPLMVRGREVAPLRPFKAYILGGACSGTGFLLECEPDDLQPGDLIRVSYVSEDQFCRFLSKEVAP